MWTIPDHAECALPKTEAGWMSGVQMKASNNPTLKEEIEQFKRELKEIPEPNFGRIQELKERIKKKTLITKEAIEEAAERITERFLGRS